MKPQLPKSTLLAMVALLAIASPGLAQRNRTGLPGFFDEGLDRFEDEIENFQNINRGNDLLTIETASGEWEAFESPQGRFAIRFPQAPVTDNPILETEAADLPLTRFISADETQTFVLAYGDYPETADLDNPEAILAQVQEAIVGGLGVEVADDRAIALGDYPGREFSLPLPEGTLTFRLYLAGDRLYLLGSERPSDSEVSENAIRFFESFQVLESESVN